MGIADALRRGLSITIGSEKAALPATFPRGQMLPAPYVPNMIQTPMVEYVLGMDPAEVWRTQPYLRTVVTFMARNIAQLGLHTFERVSDTDRKRLMDHPMALLLKNPSPDTTAYELMYQLVADLALYDRAYWWVTTDATSISGYRITRLPPSWVVGLEGGTLFAPDGFIVQPNTGLMAGRITVPAAQIVYFHGWSPHDPRTGSSPVEALKQILAEQVSAMQYRQQVWARGGRASAILTRPADAPTWDGPTRQRFLDQFRSKYASNDGSEAGGVPLLEDGMTLTKAGFSAHEDEFVEATKLAINIVCAVYHINPTMVGILDNANYSNVREFRKMLYGDTLGPPIAMIEDRINTFVIPRLPSPDRVYVEFNIAEKLQGSFEEQATALQTAVGRPWMSADEARARANMPAMGGDAAKLVTPLNVLVGGQASPRDSAPPPKTAQQIKSAARVSFKANGAEEFGPKFAEIIRSNFERQRKAALSAYGAQKAKTDAETVLGPRTRWDSELATDMQAGTHAAVIAAAKKALEDLGIDDFEFDESRVRNWIAANAKYVSEAINTVTYDQVEEALTADDPAQALSEVFDLADLQRAGAGGFTQAANVSGFAIEETAYQTHVQATKEWDTGRNPRPSHAGMNGETQIVGEPFSNGALWPGDYGLDPAERAGCNCTMIIYSE